MKITVVDASADGKTMTSDVSDTEMVDNVKALVEVEFGIPIRDQLLTFNGTPLQSTQTLSAAGVKDNDMLLVQRAPGASGAPAARPTPLTGAAGTGAGAGAGADRPSSPSYHGLTWEDIPPNMPPDRLHKVLQQNPTMMSHLKLTNPDMHTAAADPDPSKLRLYLLNAEMDKASAQLEENRLHQRLQANPTDPEAQAKMEEIIRLRNVESNRLLAMEHMPESFFRVHMLYVQAEVNGVPIKAFVDSGAQNTIMSKQCATKCGIMRLVDTRFAGTAVGVGSAPIVGKVHMAQLKLGSTFFQCAFTVMDQPNMEFLLGLDMLKRYRCCIDLKDNVLRLNDASAGSEAVPFLGEREVPDSQFNPRSPTPGPTSPAPVAGSGSGAAAGAGTHTRAATPPMSGVVPASASAGAPAPPAAPDSSRAVDMFGVLPPSLFQSLGGASGATSGPAAPPATSSGGGSAASAPAPAASGVPPAVPAAVRGSGAAAATSSGASHESGIAALTAMGFSEGQAREALTVCNGNVDQAANYLMSQK